MTLIPDCWPKAAHEIIVSAAINVREIYASRNLPAECSAVTQSSATGASAQGRFETSKQKRPPEEGNFSQHQVSVRRDAVHSRASRFELLEYIRVGPEREASHEASDNFCSCDY